jgi:hypothetical protein
MCHSRQRDAPGGGAAPALLHRSCPRSVRRRRLTPAQVLR